MRADERIAELEKENATLRSQLAARGGPLPELPAFLKHIFRKRSPGECGCDGSGSGTILGGGGGPVMVKCHYCAKVSQFKEDLY